MTKKLAGEGCQVPTSWKTPRKPKGREQSQIQLPPKKRAKTNKLSVGNLFKEF